MQQQLQDMAGPNAILRIDSFEGGRLPPKSQIKSIHITRDAFAAENHSAHGLFIDIITQPGVGPLRGGANIRLRDGSMSARSPLTTTKGPERMQNYGAFFSGSLLKEKSSFSLSLNGGTSFATPNRFVYIPGVGPRSEPLDIRQPSDNVGIFGLVDYAITRDQTLRINMNRFSSTQRNLGIGGNDEIERAFSTENTSTFLRIQEAGPLGRRFFTNTRLQVGRTSSDSSSAIEAPTFRITDARTTGGAQVSGGRQRNDIQPPIGSRLRPRHPFRARRHQRGWRIGTGRMSQSNYLGTYLFESPAAFELGRPTSYTRRIGDPNITYKNVQAGFYLQDDIRLRKNLTLSPGLRYEVQTHLRDYNNVGPRFGMTWSPFKNGKTSLRDKLWRFLRLAERQHLRADAARGRLPAAGTEHREPVVSRSRQRRKHHRDQSIPSERRSAHGAEHARQCGHRSDAVAPCEDKCDVRPHKGLGPFERRESECAGRRRAAGSGFRQHREGRGGRRLAAAHAERQRERGAGAAVAPLQLVREWNWKRTSFNVNYSTGRLENNTDGAFSLPFTRLAGRRVGRGRCERSGGTGSTWASTRRRSGT